MMGKKYEKRAEDAGEAEIPDKKRRRKEKK